MLSSPWLSLFSSYTINNSRQFNPWAVTFAIPFVSAHTPPLHQLGGAGLGCRFQDETLKHQWFVYALSDYTVAVHTRISVHDADYYCKFYYNISDWDTVEWILFRSIHISFPFQPILI